jgi:hypothetical protein
MPSGLLSGVCNQQRAALWLDISLLVFSVVERHVEMFGLAVFVVCQSEGL